MIVLCCQYEKMGEQNQGRINFAREIAGFIRWARMRLLPDWTRRAVFVFPLYGLNPLEEIPSEH
jgi:hypothetical protein